MNEGAGGPRWGVPRHAGSAAAALASDQPASLSSGNVAPYVSEATGTKPGDWDWKELDAQLRPHLLRKARIDFRFTKEEAEDALQTAYLRVIDRDPRVKEPAKYIRVAFTNTCINMAMAPWRTRRESLTDVVGDRFVDRVDEKVIARMYSIQVANIAVRSATPRCKRIVKLYFEKEQTLNEMSRSTGYSQKTVWKRIWSCLRKMRSAVEGKMGEGGLTPPWSSGVDAPEGAMASAFTSHPEPWDIDELEIVGLTDGNMRVEEHLHQCGECQETQREIRALIFIRWAHLEDEKAVEDFPSEDCYPEEKEAFYAGYKNNRKPTDKAGGLAYEARFLTKRVLDAAEDGGAKEGLEKAAMVLAALETNPARGYAMLYAPQHAWNRVPKDPARALGLVRLTAALSRSIPYKENLSKEQPVSREKVLGECSLTESYALNYLGKHQEARAAAKTAARWFRAVGDDAVALSLADYCDASAASFANQFGEAARLFKKAVRVFAEYGMLDWVGRTEGALGTLFLHKGRHKGALYHFDQAVTKLHPEAEEVTYTSVMLNRAFCLVRLNHLDEAKKTYARVLVKVRRAGFKGMLYAIRHGLASIELKKGAHPRALELFTNLSRDAKADGMNEHVLTAELHIAECVGRLGRYDEMTKRAEVLRTIELSPHGTGPALLELFESLDEGAVSPELLAHVAEYVEDLAHGNVVPYRSFKAHASR